MVNLKEPLTNQKEEMIHTAIRQKPNLKNEQLKSIFCRSENVLKLQLLDFMEIRHTTKLYGLN